MSRDIRCLTGDRLFSNPPFRGRGSLLKVPRDIKFLTGDRLFSNPPLIEAEAGFLRFPETLDT